jgi:hypothetical protein
MLFVGVHRSEQPRASWAGSPSTAVRAALGCPARQKPHERDKTKTEIKTALCCLSCGSILSSYVLYMKKKGKEPEPTLPKVTALAAALRRLPLRDQLRASHIAVPQRRRRDRELRALVGLRVRRVLVRRRQVEVECRTLRRGSVTGVWSSKTTPIANHYSITQLKKECILRTLGDRGACVEHLSVLRF